MNLFTSLQTAATSPKGGVFYGVLLEENSHVSLRGPPGIFPFLISHRRLLLSRWLWQWWDRGGWTGSCWRCSALSFEMGSQ